MLHEKKQNLLLLPFLLIVHLTSPRKGYNKFSASCNIGFPNARQCVLVWTYHLLRIHVKSHQTWFLRISSNALQCLLMMATPNREGSKPPKSTSLIVFWVLRPSQNFRDRHYHPMVSRPKASVLTIRLPNINPWLSQVKAMQFSDHQYSFLQYFQS